jgi:hypothetical protein
MNKWRKVWKYFFIILHRRAKYFATKYGQNAPYVAKMSHQMHNSYQQSVCAVSLFSVIVELHGSYDANVIGTASK